MPIWRPAVRDAESGPFLTRPTPARRDALFLERRSQSPVSLQRTPPVIELSWQLGVGGWKRSTLQSPSSLRPCWDVILSILREHISFVLQVLG